jgi:hypothetical protein
VVALCLTCRHEAVIPPETLRQKSLRDDVSLAFLSRIVVCQECGSRAVKLERRPVAAARDTA